MREVASWTATPRPPRAASPTGACSPTGRPRAGVWAAPGRVNLIGEHTDYNDGFALRQSVRAAVRLRADGVPRLHSSRIGGDAVEVRPAGLAPGHPSHRAAEPAPASLHPLRPKDTDREDPRLRRSRLHQFHHRLRLPRQGHHPRPARQPGHRPPRVHRRPNVLPR
ncbi:galactokinase family protein [Kitasatospora sp. NPDC057198]|uniref:galactokinase family protein n=1 Tax=Kitasatospora sp. NPDC057198 TaxID=3346046 RepID=UPI0036370CDA